jgi:hypothetical protein
LTAYPVVQGSRPEAEEMLRRLPNCFRVMMDGNGSSSYVRRGPGPGRAGWPAGRQHPCQLLPGAAGRQGVDRRAPVRTCYDHLAGALGVAITTAMTDRGLLDWGNGLSLTPDGARWLAGLGIELPSAVRRPPVRSCIDWTERRPHLAGGAGAALCGHAFRSGGLPGSVPVVPWPSRTPGDPRSGNISAWSPAEVPDPAAREPNPVLRP